MKKTLTIFLLNLLLLTVGECDSLQKQLFIIDSLFRLDFCAIVNGEGNSQAVSCHPDARSGKVELRGGGITENAKGELVFHGERKFHTREFGILKPIFQLPGRGQMTEIPFDWEIDSHVGLSKKKWEPFGFKYYQEGGCGIVELNTMESGDEQMELIALFPCEWKSYLQETAKFIDQNNELFSSSLVSPDDEERLREITTGNSNPLLSFIALRRFIRLEHFDNDYVVRELNKSKGLKLSLIVYLLLEEMESDMSSSIIGKYLEQNNPDVEAIADAAFAKFAQDPKNREFNRFNRNQKEVSGKLASKHPTFQSNQEYLNQQGSYRILARINSSGDLTPNLNEIVKRSYF